ncbi:MAG: hypothetical protein VX311_08625, partial [Planctomycetota bacterium]|nr:hypothetical protein [Planctomycetota bacterium]
VETALIEFINPALVDAEWWPSRREELLEKQMSLEDAIRLSPDLPAFIERVESQGFNGIVGGLENYDAIDGADLMDRILDVSRSDLVSLLTTG